MQFSTITNAISSAYNTVTGSVSSACTTTVDCISEYSVAAYDWVCEAGKITGNTIVITTETVARITWEAISILAGFVWWLVTLPINIVMTILFYVFMYAMGKILERQMAEAEEEMRFQNAKPIIDMA
jgi:hypothetical protein